MNCEPDALSVTVLTDLYGDASQQGIPPACPDPAAVRPWVWQPWQAAEKQKDWRMNMCTGCPASSSDCFLLSQSDNRAVSQNLLRWLLSGRSQQKQGERELTKGLVSLPAVSVSGRLAMQTNESSLELARGFWQTRVFVTATFIGDNWHDCVLSRHLVHFCIISCLVQGCRVHPREDWGMRTAWGSSMSKSFKKLDLLCKKSYSLDSL